MLVDLDNEDEEEYKPEPVTDPIIQRYAGRLHALTSELIKETEHYDLNRDQVDQLISVLSTVGATLVFSDNLATLDAMLGMTFPSLHYTPENDVLVTLTTFPLSGTN